MNGKPRIFLTSNVFSEDEIGSNEKISINIRDKISQLWNTLNSISDLKLYDGRFPTEEEMHDITKNFNPNIIGCHLSHPITTNIVKNPDLFAISTSTAGFNHISRPENDDVIITHTPGVLFETVADYSIAIIMANLRNLIDLHQYVWDGNWEPDEKWDLDQNLSSIIDNKVVGIVGLGEIGQELMKRLYKLGVKVIYTDVNRALRLERIHPGLDFMENIEDVFREADIVSIHVPLNEATKNMVDGSLLKLMKKNALLINTARGGIVDFDDLLNLLENGEIKINLSFDVYPEEPISKSILARLKAIKKKFPELRMVLLPHNASADADTRGKMDILFLEDIIKLIDSNKVEDLEDIHLIPAHKKKLKKNQWRIKNYWNSK
ncbi:MAG: hypothetical protein GF317_00800 [Candidatus Lokiarchaeota archaeon]|nr:hypothetical protein [Candidatus Lokiarchaeota archaeon]MBD3198499.1 hypothetical protein [Candidatus Lokiarchaeota archaeon]